MMALQCLFFWSLNAFLSNKYFSKNNLFSVLNKELASRELETHFLSLSHDFCLLLRQSALKSLESSSFVCPQPPAIRRSERYINSALRTLLTPDVPTEVARHGPLIASHHQ